MLSEYERRTMLAESFYVGDATTQLANGRTYYTLKSTWDGRHSSTSRASRHRNVLVITIDPPKADLVIRIK